MLDRIFSKLTDRFEKREFFALGGLTILLVVGLLMDILESGRFSWFYMVQDVVLFSLFAVVLESRGQCRRGILVSESILHRQDQDFRQIESLLGIYMFIKPSMPLPHTRGWAASPDFLNMILEISIRNRPTNVLEASSGISSLISGYVLKKLNIAGRVFSLEHDARYAEKTRRLVKEHGLEDIVSVIHAPLTTYELSGRKVQWYETSNIPRDVIFDLFIIDGPPADVDEIDKFIRWPAMPLFYERLSQGAVILLDDAKRLAERSIVDQWLRDYPGLDHEYFQCEKGAAVLTKRRK